MVYQLYSIYSQVTKSLRDTINDIQQKIGKRMYEMCLSGRMPESQELLVKDDITKMKRFKPRQNSSATLELILH